MRTHHDAPLELFQMVYEGTDRSVSEPIGKVVTGTAANVVAGLLTGSPIAATAAGNAASAAVDRNPDFAHRVGAAAAGIAVLGVVSAASIVVALALPIVLPLGYLWERLSRD